MPVEFHKSRHTNEFMIESVGLVKVIISNGFTLVFSLFPLVSTVTFINYGLTSCLATLRKNENGVLPREKSAYINSVWDNWRIWMICSQFPSENNLQSIRILTMLTVATSHLMRKIAFEGRKPAMENSVFIFPPLLSLYSLRFRHFILTPFGKSQSSFSKR